MILIQCDEICVIIGIKKFFLILLNWTPLYLSVYLNNKLIMLCKGKSIEVIAVKWMELINNTIFFSSDLYFIYT